MIGGKTLLDQMQMVLRDIQQQHTITVYIDIFDNSLSRKWLTSLNELLRDGYHLEKNYCFVGWADSDRDGAFILDSLAFSIAAINAADLGYNITESFCAADLITQQYVEKKHDEHTVVEHKMNLLHKIFEDLQGVSGQMSQFYEQADAEIRWHIRQLNLLCHEFENWMISWRKKQMAPDWQRPSQLMCWLRAPRFRLDRDDYDLFGIDTLSRPLGGVFVGVNKAVGKHHWEVFNDEGRDSRLGELVTTTLAAQTEASGDFDIEWAQDPARYPWHEQKLEDFRSWLIANNFDPNDPTLTIGHPQIGQVDICRSFHTQDHRAIWQLLSQHLDVIEIRTTAQCANYDYHWSNPDYQERQIQILKGD